MGFPSSSFHCSLLLVPPPCCCREIQRWTAAAALECSRVTAADQCCCSRVAQLVAAAGPSLPLESQRWASDRKNSWNASAQVNPFWEPAWLSRGCIDSSHGPCLANKCLNMKSVEYPFCPTVSKDQSREMIAFRATCKSFPSLNRVIILCLIFQKCLQQVILNLYFTAWQLLLSLSCSKILFDPIWPLAINTYPGQFQS